MVVSGRYLAQAGERQRRHAQLRLVRSRQHVERGAHAQVEGGQRGGAARGALGLRALHAGARVLPAPAPAAQLQRALPLRAPAAHMPHTQQAYNSAALGCVHKIAINSTVGGRVDVSGSKEVRVSKVFFFKFTPQSLKGDF